MPPLVFSLTPLGPPHKTVEISFYVTTLIRNGYDAAPLAAQFNAKPIEIKVFFAGTLAGDRNQELTDQMRAAGVPI